MLAVSSADSRVMSGRAQSVNNYSGPHMRISQVGNYDMGELDVGNISI